MKNIFIAFMLTLSTFSMCQSQDTLSIDEILKMDIRTFYQRPNEDLQKLLYQLTPLGLDSFDLSYDVFSSFSIEALMITNDEDTKYPVGRVVDSLLVFVQLEMNDYTNIKQLMIATHRLNKRTASKEDWLNYTKAEYIQLADRFELDKNKAISNMNAFEAFFLKKYKNQNEELKTNYETLFNEFNVYQTEQNKLGKLVIPSTDNDNFPSMNYHKAILNCTDSTKPIILYFTGHGCINAKRLEDLGAFTTLQIYPFIKENFYFISLYVDDRSKLTDSEKQEFSAQYGQVLRNIGNLNVKIQEELTASNSQPLIVIINQEGTVISKSIGYKEIIDEQQFYEYLAQILQAYKNRN